MTVRAALVPGALALLPSYAGQVDAVAELRAACAAAVAALVDAHPTRVIVLAAPVRPDEAARGVTVSAGARVARHLLGQSSHRGAVVDAAGGDDLREGDAVLVVANGTACRSERAPGHLDERSFAFDAHLERMLCDGVQPPRDQALAEALWCHDLPVLRRLHALVDGGGRVTYADDPYGVAYWVATWARLREERSR